MHRQEDWQERLGQNTKCLRDALRMKARGDGRIECTAADATDCKCPGSNCKSNCGAEEAVALGGTIRGNSQHNEAKDESPNDFSE